MEGIKVTSTQRLELVGDGGFPVVKWRVNYVTTKGARGVFMVDDEDFNKERLPEVLAAERDRANLAFDIANGD